MEELKKFQSSTIARRRSVEDQDTILELTGKIQELQNEINNCMNVSRDFQGAESLRSGNSHVTSQPVSFQPHSIPGGMLSRSLGMPSRNDKPPDTWDTHGLSGNFFLQSTGVFFITLSTRVQSMVSRLLSSKGELSGFRVSICVEAIFVDVWPLRLEAMSAACCSVPVAAGCGRPSAVQCRQMHLQSLHSFANRYHAHAWLKSSRVVPGKTFTLHARHVPCFDALYTKHLHSVLSWFLDL